MMESNDVRVEQRRNRYCSGQLMAEDYALYYDNDDDNCGGGCDTHLLKDQTEFELQDNRQKSMTLETGRNETKRKNDTFEVARSIASSHSKSSKDMY